MTKSILIKVYFIFLLMIFFVNAGTSQVNIDDQQALILSDSTQKWIKTLISGAKAQIGKTVSYNPSYKTLCYPNGDVPQEYGACTDVIVRAFRVLGIDLQKLIHEDMQKNWSYYPKKWGLKHPDKNIDHRRVPNLATFFERIGIKNDQIKLAPGDIVIWDLGKGILHIGLLSDTTKGKTPLVVHNICCGVRQEDILNDYKVVTTYRLTDTAIQKLKILQG